MDVTSVSNNTLDIQTLLGGASKVNSANNTAAANNNVKDQKAEYARKGEPMYMEEMDADEDGVVTLDEYREYCKSKGINANQMVKMSQLASSYRTMQAETQTIDYISKLKPNAFPKLKQADSNNLRQGDANTDKTNNLSYDKYLKYCEQNANPLEIKSTAKVQASDDGNFVVKYAGKAINLYKNSERNSALSLYEDEA